MGHVQCSQDIEEPRENERPRYNGSRWEDARNQKRLYFHPLQKRRDLIPKNRWV